MQFSLSRPPRRLGHPYSLAGEAHRERAGECRNARRSAGPSGSFARSGVRGRLRRLRRYRRLQGRGVRHHHQASPSPVYAPRAPPRPAAFLEADGRAHSALGSFITASRRPLQSSFFWAGGAHDRPRLLVRHPQTHPPTPAFGRARPADVPAGSCRKTPSPTEMITGSLADSGRRRSVARTVSALPLLCAVLALGAAPARAGLLRVPRVYNALITTDERLLPSRAVSVSAPLLPVSAPLIIGPAPVASLAAVADPAPAPAPVRAAPNATQEEAKEPVAAATGNGTARVPAEKEAVAPLAPTLLPLYSPYYSYYPSLLPYSLAPHPLSSLVLFHPFLPPAPAVAPAAGPAPPTDPSGRALPPGARDEPDKDAVSVEA